MGTKWIYLYTHTKMVLPRILSVYKSTKSHFFVDTELFHSFSKDENENNSSGEVWHKTLAGGRKTNFTAAYFIPHSSPATNNQR